MVQGADGKKTYYLYPNDQTGYRNGLIAKSSRPDGPFEVCNWQKDDPNQVDGVLGFDPAVFVDDDGRVYGYWGFGESNGAELDPATMATVKPGSQVVSHMISGFKEPGVFRFFEASSIRKIKDKYVFKRANSGCPRPTIRWPMPTATIPWVLGPMAEPSLTDVHVTLTPRVTPLPRPMFPAIRTVASAKSTVSGTYSIIVSRASTSLPVRLWWLPLPSRWKKAQVARSRYPRENTPACWYTGPKVAIHEWPNNTFYGSYVEAGYGTDDKFADPYNIRNNTNAVVNNTDGSIVGYKYFNFDQTKGRNDVELVLRLTPEGLDGTIQVMIDRPWTSQGGQLLGTIELTSKMPKTTTELTVKLPELSTFAGKHALFFVFSSPTKEKSLCTLHDLLFR